MHLPSSIAFSHRTHLLTRGRFDVDALRAFPSAFSSVSRFEGSVGLVCERVGYFADLDTLSRGLSVDMREELEMVGDRGLSSRRVSMARSRAPVDFDTVRWV